jgi:hypothetical protein
VFLGGEYARLIYNTRQQVNLPASELAASKLAMPAYLLTYLLHGAESFLRS